MDTFAEGQMRNDSTQPRARHSQSNSAVRRARSFGELPRVNTATQNLLDLDSNAAENTALNAKSYRPDAKLPQMSTNESNKFAKAWISYQHEKQQVLWVEIPRPNLWVPPKGKRLGAAKRQCANIMRSLFPVARWLPLTTWASLRADIIAGLTVGIMLIPQSMSYARIAGLDFRYGLYAGLVPIFVYAFTGTSRQLAVGPVALVSLLVEVLLRGQLTEEECPLPSTDPLAANYLAGYSPGDEQWSYCPQQYAELAFLAAFMCGVFQVGAGLLQLGFLVSFLAHPVVSGFTSGAAITIGLSQVTYFVGYKVEKSPFVYKTLENIFTRIDAFDWITFLCGTSFWFMLWGSRFLANKYKRRLGWLRPCMPLASCILGIVIAANVPHFGGCGFSQCPGAAGEYAVKNRVVGEVPGGFAPISLTSFDFSKLGRVLPTAISASIIGFMESIAIAKSLAAKHKYEVDPGQELFAIGMSNLLGSMFSSYPVTGSFSRSAVSNNLGAQTNLAGFVTASLMLLTVLVLVPTKVFFFLPLFALAAIVCSSVTNLVDIAEMRYLWRVKKSDWCLWMLAFLGTLFLGVQEALLVSVGISLLVVIFESVRPQMVVLWRLPGTPIYRNVKQDSVGTFVPGVLIVRIGASMYFANVAFIRDKLKELAFNFYEKGLYNDQTELEAAVEPRVERDPTSSEVLSTTESVGASQPGVLSDDRRVRYIVIECTAVISLDSTAIHMLEGLTREFNERGIRVAFACVGSRMQKDLARAGLEKTIGARWFHHSVHSAVAFCMEHQALISGKTPLDSTSDDGESISDRIEEELPATAAQESERSFQLADDRGEAYGCEKV